MASTGLVVEVVSIGDELLIGQTVNTNAAWMGRVLEAEGWRVGRGVTIPDEREVMLDTLREAGSPCGPRAHHRRTPGPPGTTSPSTCCASISRPAGPPSGH